MQINSRLFWLFFAFIFVLIHARNIHLGYNDPLEDYFDTNEQPGQTYLYKPTPLFPKKIFNIFTGEQYNPYEQDRLAPVARRAKAIVKGDPREFMG